MFNSNNRSTVGGSNSILQAKADVVQFSKNYIQETSDMTTPLREFDIQDYCRNLYPTTNNYGIRIFLEFLFSGLLINGTQFMFRREDKRSSLYGVKLKGLDIPVVEYKQDASKTDFFWLDEESNSEGEQPGAVSEDEQPSAGSEDTDKVSKNWLDDYTQRDSSRKISIRKLKKLYEVATAGQDKAAFDTILGGLLMDSEDLNMVTLVSQSGKPIKYISGLCLTKEGKALIDG